MVVCISESHIYNKYAFNWNYIFSKKNVLVQLKKYISDTRVGLYNYKVPK